MADFTIPGEVLGNLDKFAPGDGTYIKDKTIRSSILGLVVKEVDKKGVVVISVISSFKKASDLVIHVGDVLICRVFRINNNQAYVDILGVGDVEIDIPTKAVIRREDIRSTEIDKVIVHDFFNPGDIVRAEVISLGDNKHYFLSTANKNMGVILKT